MELEKKGKAVSNTPLCTLSELLDPNTALIKGDEGPGIAEELQLCIFLPLLWWKMAEKEVIKWSRLVVVHFGYFLSFQRVG